MAKISVEFVLGLIGGIVGFFTALIVLAFGGLGKVLGGAGASTIIGQGWAAIILSILGIVGAALVGNKAKLGGWFMIVSAVGGIICVGFFYALSFILLIIAGLIAVIKKGDEK